MHFEQTAKPKSQRIRGRPMAGVLAGLKVSMSVSLRYHQGRKQHAVFKASCTRADGARAFELSSSRRP